MRSALILSIVILATYTACTKSIQNPEDLFATQPELIIEQIETDSTQFEQSWLIWFTQPLDHNHPELGTFKQRVWLSHANHDLPMIMVTEGYAANKNYASELTQLLNGNQIIVEHRYFSKSRPDSLDWKYLTIEQAANDHHNIIQFFKQLYTGKWATTGISKGGQTAIFHRAYFPNDVDVSVPYVAPINLAREDQRVYDFFDHVGTQEDRQRISNFQKSILSKREEIMPLFNNYINKNAYTFRMGIDKAFDLVVLEYPFSFWQWGGNINSIPSNEASSEQLFNHLKTCSDIGYVSDQGWESIKPFFYQAYKELGYYAYATGDLKPLLRGYDQDTISSSMFAPGGDTLQFNADAMQFVMHELIKHNPKIMAIIGENDPWGSTSLQNTNLSNTIRVVMPNGSHKTRINTLPEKTKKNTLDQLNEWIR